MAALSPFHLTLRVRSLAPARSFYGELLGCPEGRSSPQRDVLAARLRAASTRFVIGRYARFQRQVGERATKFFLGPCATALESKAFADRSQLLAK